MEPVLPGRVDGAPPALTGRSLHPPPLLGIIDPYLEQGCFVPAAAPHPSAPAAGALAAAASGFSLGHLPHRRGPWCPCDARHGRVLLWYPETEPEEEGDLVLPELAVTDPLTLKTTLLPPIPDSLFVAASVGVQKQVLQFFYFDAFFDPSESYNEAGFRVLWWSATLGTVFVYSSVSGTWTLGASIATNLRQPGYRNRHFPGPCPGFVSYARGCLYRKPEDTNKLIKLNLNSMEFSVVSLPHDYKNEDVVVSEAGDGRIGMFSLVRGPGTPPSYSIRQQNEGPNANERPMDTAIPLPDEYHFYSIASAAQEYIFIVGSRNSSPMAVSAFFSVEVKTMKLERICLSNGIPYHIIPYFGYPPTMLPRRM